MFIIHGTKRVEKKLGRVADFCPICRDLRPFDLTSVHMVSHLYFIPLGSGKLAGHFIKCRNCGVQLGAEGGKYATAERRRVDDLEDLIHRTNPGLRAERADRLALEAEIRKGARLPAERREALLMEPFVVLNPLVEMRFANSSSFDRQSGIGCLGTVLVAVTLFIASFQFKGPKQDRVLLIAGILSGLGILYTFVQLHLGPSRYSHRVVGKSLLRALAPLEPSKEEIAMCLDRSRMLGFKIGKVLKSAKVWQMAQEGQSRMSP
jgi:hypothetical protein